MSSIQVLYRLVIQTIVCLLLLEACAPAGLVKPIEKGKHAVSGSFGGPAIWFAGMPIPVPLTSLNYHYGLKEKISLTAGTGLTSLAFGTGQINAGVLAGILVPSETQKMGLSAFVNTHFMLDRWQWNFRFYPEAGFHSYREFGKHRLYAGASAWFETRFPAKARTSNNFWIPMMHAGWQKSGEKWQPSVELKWIAPNISSENLVVDYIGLAGRGSFGLYFGLLRKF
jgi:hypothetical protein